MKVAGYEKGLLIGLLVAGFAVGFLSLVTYAHTFHRIARHRNVVLRTHEGPRHLLEKLYLPTARRVKLRPDLIETIRATFARYAGRTLQIPQARHRHHFVKATVRVLEYWDSSIALFHGPREIARFDRSGRLLTDTQTPRKSVA